MPKDFSELSKLGTHRLRNQSTTMVQGRVQKDGSNGSRKVIITEPAKQDTIVKGRSWSGKPLDPKWNNYCKGCTKINSSIVGAPDNSRSSVPKEVKRIIKARKTKEALDAKRAKALTDSGDTTIIVAPDGSEHKISLDNTYNL